MKNILKVCVKSNQSAVDSSDYKAQVVINSHIDMRNIVDQLLSDGLQIDRQVAIELITRFNRTAAELVFTGNQVDTGLVTLIPEVKGLIYRRSWYPLVNKPAVSFRYGGELLVALANTAVDVVEDIKEEIDPIVVLEADVNQEDAIMGRIEKTCISRESQLLKNENPPCGIAFRRWLCES